MEQPRSFFPACTRNAIGFSCLLCGAILCLVYSTQRSSDQNVQIHTAEHVLLDRDNAPAPGRVQDSQERDQTVEVKGLGRPKVKRESDSPCTFKLFREYFSDYGYFPASGSWNMVSRPNRYQPGFCKFKYPLMPHNEVAKCLVEGKISSVTTMGDSNAMRCHSAMKSFIGACAVRKREAYLSNGFMPDKKYYKSVNRSDTEWEEELEIHERHCGGCASELSQCQAIPGAGLPAKSITAEHLSMTMIVDDSIQVRFPLRKKTVHSLDNLWALTSQETLFRYYFKGRYPDVLLVFFPSNHAKHLGMKRLHIDMEYFKALVHLYVPKTTKIFYFATFSEFESKRQGKQWINATFENMLAAEKINKMNHLMADVMRDDLLNVTENVYGFLNMVDVSRTLEAWSIDGVHMQPQWYQAAMSMFWETLCNSVRFNAF